MFQSARTHTLVINPRSLVLPVPDETARSLWANLLDFAELCRTAHERDQTDRASETVVNALRELRQALGDRRPVSDIIDLDEAAALCRMSAKTLQNRMTEHAGPPRLPGKRPTFVRSEVEAWRKSPPLRKRKRKKKT